MTLKRAQPAPPPRRRRAAGFDNRADLKAAVLATCRAKFKRRHGREWSLRDATLLGPALVGDRAAYEAEAFEALWALCGARWQALDLLLQPAAPVSAGPATMVLRRLAELLDAPAWAEAARLCPLPGGKRPRSVAERTAFLMTLDVNAAALGLPSNMATSDLAAVSLLAGNFPESVFPKNAPIKSGRRATVADVVRAESKLVELTRKRLRSA